MHCLSMFPSPQIRTVNLNEKNGQKKRMSEEGEASEESKGINVEWEKIEIFFGHNEKSLMVERLA